MDTLTRILIVEDCMPDAELNKREAMKVLKNCTFEVVETEPDFLNSLFSFKPHLILSDYSMPVFDGLTALSLAIEHTPEIPVIIVTGSVNEDTAVECMKAGAANYVIKQHIKRLGPAILHAISENKRRYEHKKAEEALRESESRYRNLFDLSPVGILLQDENNTIIDANENYCRLTGYQKQELIGKHISIIVPAMYRNSIIENSPRILSGQQLHHETECNRKDGTFFSIELTESRVTLPNGSIGIMSIANDISKRKTTEKELEFKNKHLQMLSGYAIKLTEIPANGDYGKLIVEEIKKITGAVFAAYSEYNPKDSTLITKDVSVDQKILSVLVKLTGNKILNVASQLNDETYRLILKNDSSSFDSLTDLTFGAVPQIVDISLKRMTGINRFIGISFNLGDELFGTSSFGLRKDQPDPDKDVIQSIARLTSLTLRRKKAEEEFIRSEKRYHELFDAYKDGIAIISINPDNKETSFLDLNTSAAAMLGYTRAEMMSIPMHTIESGYTEQQLIQRRMDLEQKAVCNFETEFIHKSGHLIPVEVSVTVINYGGVPALLNISRDISERRFREQLQKIQFNIANAMINADNLHQLYEAVRSELSVLLDTRNFFIAFLDHETGMLSAPFEIEEKDSVNVWPAAKSLTGRVIKQQKSLLLTRNQISQLAESGEINIIGTRSEIWLGVPLFSGKKAMGAMVVQSYDNPYAYNKDSIYILELMAHELSSYIARKEAEQDALKLSKAIEQNPVSIVITNKEGFIEYVNPKFSEITGYSGKEAIGQKPSILKSGAHSDEFYRELWQTITSGKDWQGEMQNRKRDGSFYWENVIISPILNESGKITNYVAVKEDITEKKNIIEELKIAKEKAEESDRLKTAFLQNISHEIRTPLNGILGFSELLIQEWTSPEERIEYNEAIQISGKRLIEIVSNVLDISIIETGQVILNPERFNLNTFLIDLYNFYHSQAQQKGLQLNYKPGCIDKNCEITADPFRINQVMTNLLNNAIKYTKRGEISFGYRFTNEEVVFSVSDTGIGINRAHHHRIFTRFYQAEHSSARSYEGAGLGLSISQGLVQAMGGKIWFESEAGVGSTFSFSIAVAEANEQSVKKPADGYNQVNTDIVLIADDDDTSYMLLMTTLKKRKVGIMRAETGVEAVELVKNHENIRLVLMDVKMPEMNGLEATRIIKSLKPDLPVIIQTAYAFTDDIDEAYAVGCDEYLSKPIATEKLNHIYEKFLGTN
ncbi:MAG: PAS domain S-box protein [Bacteroidales bacterium]|nr:PAS domain S-box protein [Bacteroidales bacterium]